MSLQADKKREHEQLAEKAIIDKDFNKAFFHTAKAADFGYDLAEHSDGKLARAHLDDANDLLELAAQLKVKAREQAEQRKQDNSDDNLKKVTPVEGNANDLSSDDSKQYETSIPKVTFDDVKGLDEAKEIVQDALINPTLHPDIYQAFKVKSGTGLLLYGPPGTGKSYVCKSCGN